MVTNFDRAEWIKRELESGSHVEVFKGHEIRFQHISYKVPALGIFGARDIREARRLINRAIKKATVAR